MGMAQISIDIPNELKEELDANPEKSKELQEFLKRELLRDFLLKKFNSEEEQDLTEWSIELGRKVKKERFKDIIKEVSPEVKEKLISKLSAEEKEEYLR
jgi:Mg/Co/Ni transporter MgtE|tara:strand:+ start:7872 stop:8168 length:297 start_codon:yes stop_codon:yes gene_type:complete